MSDRNPQHERFAPGSDPVPESDQIPEWPTDWAQWAGQDLPQYENGPLFGPDDGEEEATNG